MLDRSGNYGTTATKLFEPDAFRTSVAIVNYGANAGRVLIEGALPIYLAASNGTLLLDLNTPKWVRSAIYFQAIAGTTDITAVGD
mgnify:CR=1 FL=1